METAIRESIRLTPEGKSTDPSWRVVSGSIEVRRDVTAVRVARKGHGRLSRVPLRAAVLRVAVATVGGAEPPTPA